MNQRGSINTKLFISGLVLGFVAFIGFVFWLIKRVADGKGTDLYQSHWGIHYSAIGVLILLGVLVVAALFGVYLNHKHKQEENDLLAKFGKSREK